MGLSVLVCVHACACLVHVHLGVCDSVRPFDEAPAGLSLTGLAEWTAEVYHCLLILFFFFPPIPIGALGGGGGGGTGV